MKTILKDISTSILATLVLGIVLCGLYPLIVYGVGQLFFPRQANGSLIETSNHQIAGSAWLGQNFTSANYFHPRPSAAGTGYDATASGGTNLGPTSQKLMDAVKAAVAQYRTENNLPADALVPADAVTSSGSGLDPHISVRNANLQAGRVAKARGLSVGEVAAAIAKATDGPSLGIFGEAGVNVLKLNLALDASGKETRQASVLP